MPEPILVALHTPVTAPHQRRHWSDWGGLVFWSALAALTWRRSGGLGLLMLPVFAGEILLALAFLTRAPSVRQLPGWAPRLRAYACTFLFPIGLLVAAHYRPAWVSPTPWFTVRAFGLLLWALGLLFLLWPLFYLRRAFSIIPAARVLIREGPYRFVRHPMYTIYVLSYTATVLVRLTPAMALLLTAWGVLLAARIRDEERVLSAAFPEYDEYRRRAGAILPRPGVLH